MHPIPLFPFYNKLTPIRLSPPLYHPNCSCQDHQGLPDGQIQRTHLSPLPWPIYSIWHHWLFLPPGNTILAFFLPHWLLLLLYFGWCLHFLQTSSFGRAPRSRFWTTSFLISMVISPSFMVLECHLNAVNSKFLGLTPFSWAPSSCTPLTTWRLRLDV